MFQRSDVRQAQTHEIRYLQRPRFCDMPKRVASHVAIVGRVWQSPNANTVQDNPNDSIERSHRSTSSVGHANSSTAVGVFLIANPRILLTEIAKGYATRRSESPLPRAPRNFSLIDCVLTDNEVRDAHRSPMPTAASRSSHHTHRGGNPVSLRELSARL